MKQRKGRPLVWILGFLLGCGIGAFAAPILTDSLSLGQGLIASLVLLSLLIMVLMWSRRNRKRSSARPGDPAIFPWLIIAMAMVLGGVIWSGMLLRKERLLAQTQAAHQLQIRAEIEAEDAIHTQSMVVLMDHLFQQIDRELIDNPARTLSPALVSRIESLSLGFSPYSHWLGDTLYSQKLSPERAQLLMGLAALELDSATFNQIKRITTFAGADLRNAHLKGVDLSWVNLEGACLRGACLEEASFQNANLRSTDFWGAKLSGANLSETDLIRANLTWADMDGANFSFAVMNGANMANTKMNRSLLKGATIEWASMEVTNLSQANFDSAYVKGTKMIRTNLRDASFFETTFRYTHLEEVDLSNADLFRMAVDKEDWLDLLTHTHTAGAARLQKQYQVIKDTSARFNFRILPVQPEVGDSE